MIFEKLDKNLQKAIKDTGYTTPTEIQAKAIPAILKNVDLIGCAQTGTGKTAAFILPILDQIKPNKKIQALVVTPTRELAIQIHENTIKYAKYTNHKSVCIFGGVKQHHQVKQLNKGCDIIIATPGRLLDLSNQGIIDLSNVQHLVLDEADNMLDMGFIHDIKRIIKLVPKRRQNLLFSATMPKEIKKLASQILVNPQEVTVTPVASTTELVEQSAYFVSSNDKLDLLLKIMSDKKDKPTIIFTRTKHGANKLSKKLDIKGFKTAAIHGNKSQSFRERALSEFKSGKIHTLIATDIAARGIDVKDLQYVINYEIPNISETYVHRIGRTGRAKKTGVAISLVSHDEKAFFKDIEKLINKKIPIIKQ